VTDNQNNTLEYRPPSADSYKGRGAWADKNTVAREDTSEEETMAKFRAALLPTVRPRDKHKALDVKQPEVKKETTGRYFPGGAYRDTDKGKHDYSGYMSPIVIRAFGEYMTKHRTQSDGNIRPADNWQNGIDKDAYMQSMWRHLEDLWLEHDGYKSRDGLEEALGGLLFNVMGYYFEVLCETEGRPK